MSKFESGVSGYIKGTATIEVNFPIDFNGKAEVACKHCPYLSSNERVCQLNKQPIAHPNKFVGEWCPLVPEEEAEF